MYDENTMFLHIDLTYGLGLKKDEEIIYYVQDKKDNIYVNNFKLIEYNMDKIMKYWYDKDEEKIEEYKHLIMLSLGKEELNILSKGDDFVGEYNEEVTKLNDKEIFRAPMTVEEDRRKILNTEKHISFQEGKKIGQESGKKEAELEIAKNLKKIGTDINKISEVCNLSIEEIEKL